MGKPGNEVKDYGSGAGQNCRMSPPEVAKKVPRPLAHR
jgi:hypothetical protein